MRILFVTPYIPSLIRVRPYNLLKALAARGHEITLLALRPPSDANDSIDDLKAFCKALHIVPHGKSRTLRNGALALWDGMPLQAAYSRSAAFSRAAHDLLASETFDVAHVEHLRGAVLANALEGMPTVFDSVDSISLLFSKVLQDAPNLKSRLMATLDLERTKQFEARLTGRFRHVTVTSRADYQALVDLGCDARRVHVVPNGVDLDYFQPMHIPRNPHRLVFTGKMSYHANIAAAEDLVGQIMPMVWRTHPQTELYIVGKDPSPKVLKLAEDPRVTVTGSVPDLRPYLAEAAVSVSVVRYGVGIQNKVLEAMAMGTPVVCSPQANSALQTTRWHDVLVGDSPEAIAEMIGEVLDDPEKRAALGSAGRQYVETYHNWDTAAQTLETLYFETVGHMQKQVS